MRKDLTSYETPLSFYSYAISGISESEEISELMDYSQSEALWPVQHQPLV